jgi:hypothetical protein
MQESEKKVTAQKNKENYLKAKAAFNEKDMAGCMSYYALDHQIRSRPLGPGRQHIEQVRADTYTRQVCGNGAPHHASTNDPGNPNAFSKHRGLHRAVI